MSTSTFPDALPVGTKLQGGNFSLGKVLGQGGFGITYVGSDTGLRRAVAIKEFFPEGSSRQGMLVQPSGAMNSTDYATAKETFLEEARTLAQFQHPDIVDVYTVFEENNTAYMVMELLKGKTLGQLVEERGILPESEAVDYIRHAARALEVVHGKGMLHQDIKPDNIMACDDGRIVLMDFGLSQKLEAPTGLGTVRFTGHTRFGTAGYAPLEQYGRQAQVGTYTDVYALAATLYYLLTAQEPAEATDRAAGVELEDVRSLNPRVSRDVAQVTMAGLEMDARKRPQTARDFFDRLQAAFRASRMTGSDSRSERDFDRGAGFEEPRPRGDYDQPAGPSRSNRPGEQRPRVKVSLPEEYEYSGPIFEPAPQAPPPVYIPPPMHYPPARPQVVRGFSCGPMGCITMMFLLFILFSVLEPIAATILPILRILLGG
jgi:serine/threonine protein kinase